MDAADHFARLTRLLELESEEEARQIAMSARLTPHQAEAGGTCLPGLVVRDGVPGMGGRFLVVLARKDGRPLPWTRLGPGSPVVLTGRGEASRGVVSEREPSIIRVALNEPPEEDEDTFRLDLAPDEAARVRQRRALQNARAAGGRLGDLREVLLGNAAPSFAAMPPDDPLDVGLNAAQREAVCLALAARDVAVIHGPPGTGKTTAVVELVRRAVRAGERVLVCAPSNLGVDNVLERLVAHGENAVRLGHPARVLPTLRERTLDLLSERDTQARHARKLFKEAFALFRQAGKWTRGKPEPGSRQSMRREARAMIADARRMEDAATEAVLDGASVLCSTLTGLDDELLGDRRFGLVVIDEACQSTEPASWIALARAGRVVLAGDHCQLPPTVLSPQAARQGFGVSLQERVAGLFADAVTRRLDVQYRMHERIMAFPSSELYDGALLAHPSVAGHLLAGLPGVGDAALTSAPLTFIDTAGAGYDEEKEEGGESRLNTREAALAAAKVRALIAAGVAGAQIAVIAPYAAQVRLLRRLLADVEGVEIDSVDGFQGREKEAVVITMVRSNAEGELGFLSETRRTNVALTRARRCLIIIGDSATLACEPFHARLIEYCEGVGAYRTVWEECE